MAAEPMVRTELIVDNNDKQTLLDRFTRLYERRLVIDKVEPEVDNWRETLYEGHMLERDVMRAKEIGMLSSVIDDNSTQEDIDRFERRLLEKFDELCESWESYLGRRERNMKSIRRSINKLTTELNTLRAAVYMNAEGALAEVESMEGWTSGVGGEVLELACVLSLVGNYTAATWTSSGGDGGVDVHAVYFDENNTERIAIMSCKHVKTFDASSLRDLIGTTMLKKSAGENIGLAVLVVSTEKLTERGYTARGVPNAREKVNQWNKWDERPFQLEIWDRDCLSDRFDDQLNKIKAKEQRVRSKISELKAMCPLCMSPHDKCKCECERCGKKYCDEKPEKRCVIVTCEDYGYDHGEWCKHESTYCIHCESGANDD